MTCETMRGNFIKNLHKKQEELCKRQSYYDLAIQDILHTLENENCDAVILVKLAACMRKLQKDRRSVKIEIEKLQSMTSALRNWDPSRFETKTYTYKTKIIDEIYNTK